MPQTSSSSLHRESISPILLTDKASARLLGISRATFRRRVSEGVLPAPLRLGGCSRWRRSDLEAFVEQWAPARGDTADTSTSPAVADDIPTPDQSSEA